VPLSGAAAARLYDDHVDAVYALLTRRVGTEASPGLTAETFTLALQTWDSFDNQRGTERLFLYGAATATLRRHDDEERAHLRSLRMSTSDDNGAVHDPLISGQRSSPARVVDHDSNRDVRGDGPDDEQTYETDAADARTMRAVAELDSDDRDILLLSLWESCPQSAIAEALDVSVGSVRSALGRIRRELKIATSKDAS